MAIQEQPEIEEVADELISPSIRTHPLWQRVLLFLLAMVFMMLGFVLWLVPVVTGIPFWILGFIVLAMVSHRCRRAINRLDRKLPIRARMALRRARDRMHRKKASRE